MNLNILVKLHVINYYVNEMIILKKNSKNSNISKRILKKILLIFFNIL